MLSEISQMEKNMISLICGIKQQTQPQTRLIDREHIGGCQKWGVGVGEMGEGCPKVQTSSYKIIKVEDVTYSILTIVNNTILYI